MPKMPMSIFTPDNPAFSAIYLVYGNFLGKSDVRGEKKERKKDCPIHFFKKYSSMSMSEK
jgi:hypothetical protein